MRARIEAAAPFSRISVKRVADPLGNRADMNIAVQHCRLCSDRRRVSSGMGLPLLLRLARVWSGGPRALQDSHLLNNARKIRNCLSLMVDGSASLDC